MDKQPGSDKLVDTGWVAANLKNPAVRIIEVGDLKDPDAYFAGHIPGAVHWPWEEVLWETGMREIVSPESFAALMRQSGIGHDTIVVLYSSLCQYATYAFWVCAMRGHDNVRIMNGNRALWINEGRPISREIPVINPSDYPLRPVDETSRIGRESVRAGLNNPDRVLLDMRTPEEFTGERVSPPWFEVDHGAVKKGRIPGARHFYYLNLLNQDETYKPADQLLRAFSDVGASPDREIVFYCRLSHRATLGWFVARYLLGYRRVKVYDGSWTEWGSMFGMPIVNLSIKKA
ncbi:MAG: sulfurtransferase [Thermodesulfobacteriota bacterium]